MAAELASESEKRQVHAAAIGRRAATNDRGSAVSRRLPKQHAILRIRAARWRECVYVLQSVFLFSVFFCFFFRRPPQRVHKYETTVLGNG